MSEEKSAETGHSGGCLCGAVRFLAKGDLRPVVNCHCGQCRRFHGHYAAYSSVALDSLAFTTDQGLKWFRSSDKAERGFCSHCGSSLFWKPDGQGRIAVSAGAFDQPSGLETVAHIFLGDQADYYQLTDDLDRYDRGLG